MSVVKITKENFEELVLKSDKTVLLDFYANWCGPCKMVAPILEEIATEHPEYLIGKVNVDEEGELAMKFGVMSIPMLVVMRDGEIDDKLVGARPKASILEFIEG
jgi:thioredoxin 1